MSKKNKLIVEQLLEIKKLNSMIEEVKEQKAKVYGLLYNIGAPLNDNKLRFNPDQLRYLFLIVEALDLD